MTCWCIDVVNGNRQTILLAPLPDRETAERYLPRVKEIARSIDRRADEYTYRVRELPESWIDAGGNLNCYFVTDRT